MSGQEYKEYLDDALFAKNMTVTYKMLSFKEKISSVIAQQVLEAYMKENIERVCGLYLTKPSDSTFALKSSAELDSEPQQVCHIYSISGKSTAKEEDEAEKKIIEKNEICTKTWESDKAYVFKPLLANKPINDITENPLLSSAFSSIEPPPREEMELRLRPTYAHDPVPTHSVTKAVSTPSVKLEKSQSTESSSSSSSHITKSKTSDLGSLFTKSASTAAGNKSSTAAVSSSSSITRKSSTNQLSFFPSSSTSTLSTKSTVATSSTSSKSKNTHKPKLKRLRKQVDDDDEDGDGEGSYDEEEDEEGGNDDFFDDLIDNNDDGGFLDDGNGDDIILPVKRENSSQEVKKPVQAARPPPAAAPAPVVSKPQPPKKKPAPSKKKSSSGGTQTSIASFFCAKK